MDIHAVLYAVIPVTIDFVNLQYTGKSTLLQMWGHFILSKIKFNALLVNFSISLYHNSESVEIGCFLGRFPTFRIYGTGGHFGVDFTMKHNLLGSQKSADCPYQTKKG